MRAHSPLRSQVTEGYRRRSANSRSCSFIIDEVFATLIPFRSVSGHLVRCCLPKRYLKTRYFPSASQSPRTLGTVAQRWASVGSAYLELGCDFSVVRRVGSQ